MAEIKDNIYVYTAGDYAGIKAPAWSAYYGFEHTNGQDGRECDPECDSEDWCFVFNKNGKDTVIPFGKLGAEDMFEVQDCLIRGLAIVINKL